MNMQVPINVKSATLSAVITKADGTKIDLGVIASTEQTEKQ